MTFTDPRDAEIAHLTHAVQGMKVKLAEYKAFKGRYDAMCQENALYGRHMSEVDRVADKALRALSEISAADKSFRRKQMIDYASKVLKGLGYDR